MLNRILKAIFLSFLFMISLSAEDGTNANFQKELYNIKVEIEKLKLTQKYQDNGKKIEEIEKSIKSLESKVNLYNKKNIALKKDTESLDKRINDFNSDLTWYGMIVTVLVVLIALGTYFFSSSKAESQMKDWLKEKASKEFEPEIKKYLKELEDKGVLVIEKIENMASKKLEEKIAEFDLEKGEITESFKRELKESVKKLEQKDEEELNCNQLYELFLSRYFEEDYIGAHEYIDKVINYCRSSKEFGKYYYAKALTFKKENKLDEVIKYYKMAIEKGNAEALNNLGYIYQHEKKYKNIEEAIYYYKRAIENGLVESMISLSYIYINENKFKNIKNGIMYSEMAVEKDDPRGMNNLGYIYESEYKDLGKALKYYLMAIVKGNKDAIDSIKEIIRSNNIKEFISDLKEHLILLLAKKDYQLAFELFEENKLRDEFKDIYYTLEKLSGKEITENYSKKSISSILEKIEEKSKKYN